MSVCLPLFVFPKHLILVIQRKNRWLPNSESCLHFLGPEGSAFRGQNGDINSELVINLEFVSHILVPMTKYLT